jgi:acetyl esterase
MSNEKEFTLDPRLADEARAHVLNTLRTLRPIDMVKMDIHQVRAWRSALELKALETVNTDDLTITDHYAPSILDGYSINIKMFAPKTGLVPHSPITVFYHGGGYVFGSVISHFLCVTNLARLTRSVWLSVEYRLAPEHKFDSIYSDCASAFKWISENKASFSSVDAKLGVCGDSAGAQLSALLAHDNKHEISYQILVYPVVDVFRKFPSNAEFQHECFLLIPEMLKMFVQHAFEDVTSDKRNSPSISPILKDNFQGLPKCLLIAAELDPLVDHSSAYYQKLKDNNIDVDLLVVPGAIHGFFSRPSINPKCFELAASRVVEFFNSIHNEN